ncbi:hypothetical protein [Nocardia sp. NPDC057440]|uniref:hypothetical protein n=1 Tax=Nocardia sp. NPDC057440 TaxID=3346134 RepID=UPI00366B61B5
MSECEKCIQAQDQRDPFGAPGRRRMRALYAMLAPTMPVWDLPDDDTPPMVCIDCPACGGHWLVSAGEQWCWKCSWELTQVERHEGPPIETGWKIGDLVQHGWTAGRVSYIDPSGFVDVLSAGWTVRVDDPAELESYQPPWEREGGATP